MKRCGWAIAGAARDIRAAETAGLLKPVRRGWTAVLRDGTAASFSRLYSGAEFCRHLIPSRAEWAAVLALARARRVPVTLRTPPATDDDLPRLSRLLTALSGLPGAEVVVNDWGVLSLAGRKFPRVRPVLGRCLRRHKKDPRVRDPSDPGALHREFRRLLARSGIRLLEVDKLPHGPSPVPLAMHVPFTFVASGSLCALSGLGRSPRAKFRPDQPCPAPCRGLRVKLSHRALPAPMTLKENTFFLRSGPAPARPDIARFVYDLDADRGFSLLRPGPGGRP